MIRRNTWILLVLLVALVGVSYYLSNQKAKQAAAATPTAGPSSLFGAAEGNPTDIKIENTLGNSVEIARDATGTWVVKAPTAAPANQGDAEAAATQVGALRVLAGVQLGLDVVGLDKPADTITITFSGGKSHKLEVGSVTPIQDGYYVQLDGEKPQIVDKPGLDALLGLLTTPPYLATLTPVASDTPTAIPETPTPEVTSTPTAAPITATPTKSP